MKECWKPAVCLSRFKQPIHLLARSDSVGDIPYSPAPRKELMADATAKNQVNPSHQLRLVPHVIASFGIFCPLHESLDELAMDRLSMIDRIEGFLFRIGRWPEIYKMQRFHFRKTEKMLGKKHASTLINMKNLTLILSRQGKYSEAEEIYRKELALCETVLGKEYLSERSKIGMKRGLSQDIARLILPSAETLATYGATNLNYLIIYTRFLIYK